MDELGERRQEIDKIDDEIFRLLSNRVDIIKKIKQHKEKHDIPITNEAREKEILERLNKKAKEHHLDEEYINEIFKKIITHSKEIQNGDQINARPLLY